MLFDIFAVTARMVSMLLQRYAVAALRHTDALIRYAPRHTLKSALALRIRLLISLMPAAQFSRYIRNMLTPLMHWFRHAAMPLLLLPR